MHDDQGCPQPAWAVHLADPQSANTIDILAERSLAGAWTARWREDPDRVVACTLDGAVLRADELETRSRCVAGRLAAAGLAPGDRIVFSAEPSLDFIVSYVAAHRLGLIVVPINTAYGEREIAAIAQATAPAAAVVDDERRAGMLRRTAPPPLLVVGCDVALPDGPDPDLDEADSGQPALIVHTSGTTGAPKGAVLTTGNLLASAQAVRLAWRWTPDDRLALALPLFHLHGLGVGIHGSLVAGASMVLAGKFGPEAVEAALVSQHATMFFGVPTMYHRLAVAGVAPRLASLRLCVSGSAPLPTQLFDAIEQASGQRILERYGMSETVMNVSNPYEPSLRRPGTIGFPLPGVEIRLAGDGGPGEGGEIQIRGANVFSGYWGQPDATAAAFTDDGWFCSGDLGRTDDEGYLSIVGRMKDLIISGGYNVYPAEVEIVLREHPGIQDVAVVGLPSEEWGETVVAFVVANGPVSEGEVLTFCSDRLAPYKRPRAVRFIDEVPRNELGKVLRTELVASGR